ncbi:MAG TPA: hypothetical protein VLW50_05890 [Streptosporangiaceae bacterium]|nr:hypothetical protein [Streptosporangiaceae bacterium]
MSDAEEDKSGAIPRLIQEFIAQVRGITERLDGLTRVGESLPSLPPALSLSSLRNLLAPGALSAAQLNALAANITEQRRSIQTLKTDLTVFDQQLAILQRILDPLTEWSRTWADLEGRLTGRRQAADGPADGC